VSNLIAVVSPITNNFLCLIRQVRQQYISLLEITDLPRSQMKADRSAVIITRGVKF
jgi:hypothetical protein